MDWVTGNIVLPALRSLRWQRRIRSFHRVPAESSWLSDKLLSDYCLQKSAIHQMIDKFQRIAQSMRILLLPSMLVGSICFVSMAIIVIGVRSEEFERFLMPSLVGFVWAATTYSFVVTFCTIPEKADKSQGLIGKFKRRISRGWYWVLAVVFLGTTVAALILTGRLMSIWLKD
jgi:hypothetical protein